MIIIQYLEFLLTQTFCKQYFLNASIFIYYLNFRHKFVVFLYKNTKFCLGFRDIFIEYNFTYFHNISASTFVGETQKFA